MKLNKKVFIIITFVIGLISLLIGSIAYYRIVVNGSITGNTGNAVFVLRDTEAGESWNNKNINLGTINPGDSGSFDVVMDASGSSVDMYATLDIERNNLPGNLKFYTTADHKSELHKYYSFLEKNGTNKEKLTVYWYWNPYISDEDDNKYVNKTFTANITVNAVQISEYATMKNGYSDSSGANGGTEFWNDNYKPYIRTINFGNDLSNLPSSCTEENLCWDISESATQRKKVYGYLVDTGLKDSTDNTKSLYNLYIVSDAPIFAPFRCSNIFSFQKYKNNKYTSNLTQINFNDNFNTSNTYYMDEMFKGCISIVKLNLDNFNTSKVVKMSSGTGSGMFFDCSNLKKLYISNFNTKKLQVMGSMFEGCSSLTSLDISSFNTANVIDMVSIFDGCSSLTSLDLSGFNTASVTSMSQMFLNCSSLTNLDLSSFNTANVTGRMFKMFYGCSSLTSLDLSNFNTANVKDMGSMFADCSSLTNLDLSNFNTANVTDMSYMFSDCSSLTSLDLSNFNTANVANMYEMFRDCRSLTSLDLSSFNTTRVTNMTQMFYSCSSLTTTINIMNANVSYYYNMFYNAATNSGSQITVNYIASASTLVDKMIAEKSSNSNVIKGNIIPEYSITITGNDDIKYESINRVKGTKVTLTSISGNNYVTSFKMNGTTINGNEFIMPDTDVTITDIVATTCKTIESAHNPYPKSQNNVILGEHTFEGAKSLTVILDYQTEGTSYDYFLIYDSSTSTTGINNNKKYGGKTRTQETITINSNYIKITFKSDSSDNNYYGIKAIVIPNY